jgi:glutamate synthase domain-containing protein 1
MCGIAAIIYKGSPASRTIGRDLLAMLQAMRHRGADSTGVTICGEKLDDDALIFRMRLNGDIGRDDYEKRIGTIIGDAGGRLTEFKRVGDHVRIVAKLTTQIRPVADSLASSGLSHVDSIGRNSEVIKDVGDANVIDQKHKVSRLVGTHGVGHVRLATESQVDVTHSHPFWAYPFPDITVVHNGQITNYRKLKRIYEEKGYHFQTHNDSELIGVYLADQLSGEIKLSEALDNSLSDLDGSYTYLVSTAEGIGFAKEKWCFKPLLYTETDSLVAIASEEGALCAVIPEGISRIEPQERATYTWFAS